MFFSPNKLRDLVRTRTEKQVSQEYIYSLIIHLQNYTEELVKLSEKELEKQNEQRKIQGLYLKRRINQDCLRGAIIINPECLGNSPGKAGGTQKEGENNEKHTPKYRKNQEVEIP